MGLYRKFQAWNRKQRREGEITRRSHYNSKRARSHRLAIGGAFTALGIPGSARIIADVVRGHASKAELALVPLGAATNFGLGYGLAALAHKIQRTKKLGGWRKD